MKASKAQAAINKQTKAILNILVFMLREGDMDEKQVQKIMAGEGILDLEPIAPNKKPKKSAEEVAVEQPEEKPPVAEADSRNMSQLISDDDNTDEPNPLPTIANDIVDNTVDDQSQV